MTSMKYLLDVADKRGIYSLVINTQHAVEHWNSTHILPPASSRSRHVNKRLNNADRSATINPVKRDSHALQELS